MLENVKIEKENKENMCHYDNLVSDILDAIDFINSAIDYLADATLSPYVLDFISNDSIINFFT